MRRVLAATHRDFQPQPHASVFAPLTHSVLDSEALVASVSNIRQQRCTVMNPSSDNDPLGVDPNHRMGGATKTVDNGEGKQESLSHEVLASLLDQWKSEHNDLTHSIRETTLWLGQVSQLGIPRFGELAARLDAMRRRMSQHFEREEILNDDLQRSADCLEVKTTRQRSISDHKHLTQRIDDLISRLSELDPPFESFQQAIDQVGLFVDAFEQHEEQEAQGLQWLTHYNSDPRRLPR
jgi:hypothetical protein